MGASIPEQGITSGEETTPVATSASEAVAEVSSEATETQQPSGQETSSTEESINPAWSDLLKEIPEGFKNVITPHLKKWDQGVNDRFQQKAQELQQLQQQIEQYKPYQQFVERRMPPQQIAAAMVILDELNRDPRALYQRIAEHYGFNESQQDPDDGTYDPDAEGQQIDPAVAQQMQALQQQQQQMHQFISQQQQAQIEQQARQEVDQEFDAVIEKYNLTDPHDRREVAQRAVLIAQTDPNAQNVFETAYRQYDQFKRDLYARMNNRPAPNVVSPGGSVPPEPSKGFADKSEQEQRDELEAALEAAFQNGS